MTKSMKNFPVGKESREKRWPLQTHFFLYQNCVSGRAREIYQLHLPKNWDEMDMVNSSDWEKKAFLK